MKKSLVAVFLLTAFAAHAATSEHVVTQKGRKFSEKKMTLAVGDTIKFVNDDDVTHNIHSTSSGHAFDVGALKPGKAVTHKFSKPGKVKIRCAIHPKMKIRLTIK